MHRSQGKLHKSTLDPLVIAPIKFSSRTQKMFKTFAVIFRNEVHRQGAWTALQNIVGAVVFTFGEIWEHLIPGKLLDTSSVTFI